MAKFQNIIGESVLSPPCRIQYPYLAEPDTGGQFSDDKYKGTFLFDKEETDFEKMKKVVDDLSMLAFGVPGKEIEFVPFKNGDEKAWQGFPGTIYILARSKFPIDVWSPKKDAQTGELYKIDPRKVYAGAIVRAHFTSLAYKSRGNERGITFMLDFIQFLEDAPRFGGIGQIDARDVFEEWESKRAPRTATQAAAEADEEEVEVEQTKPKRGRPKKQAEEASEEADEAQETASEEAQVEESPAAKARRAAAEARDKDKKNGTFPKKGGSVEDLPTAKPKAAKSGNSLMSMM